MWSGLEGTKHRWMRCRVEEILGEIEGEGSVNSRCRDERYRCRNITSGRNRSALHITKLSSRAADRRSAALSVASNMERDESRPQDGTQRDESPTHRDESPFITFTN